MNTETDSQRLETEVARLEACLLHQRDAVRRQGRTLAALALTLVGCVGWFLFDGWSTVRQQWTEERLARSFSREMEDFSPLAVGELLSLSESLMPVYAEQGRLQLEQRQGEIEQLLHQQVEAFLRELHDDTYARLLQTKRVIQEGASQALVAQYPDMDEERQQALVHLFVASVDGEINASVEGFVRRYSREVEDFADSLEQIEISGQDLSTHDLQRKLVHLWLQAIDERIMGS